MSVRRSLSVILVLLVGSAAIPLMLRAAGMTEGLRAEYFETTDRSGTPAFVRIDRQPSTKQMTADWLGDPPPAFSVRWFGYLLVDRSGSYTLGTRSDDGSWLSIDGQQIVDNGGQHSAVTRTTTVTLSSGVHPLLIEYTQEVGDFDLALLWSTSGHALADIPSWRLSSSHLQPWKFEAARVLRFVSSVMLICAVLWLGWMAATRGRSAIARSISRRPRLAALAFFIALTIVETWPLAAHPAALSRNDNGDAMLNEWTIAWVAHQAPRDPLHLFDANIFYPDRDTLAYSEAMIVQSTLAAPLFWLGASPVLAYNIVLLAGFVLGGWTMTLVMARWTGSWAAGLVSGVLFAFNAHVLTRLPHLQAQHVEFLPLALYALDALLRRPGPRRAAMLALWFVLESLTSVYLLVFTAVALVFGAIVRPEDWLGRRFRSVAPWVVAAAAGAGLMLMPFLLPYWRLFHEQGMSRSIDDVTGFAASWTDYLATPGGVHYQLWSYRFFGATALFPGVLGCLLALWTLVTGAAWRDRRARMCIAFGVAGVALSFGGKLPGYLLLFRLVPLLRGVRTVSRYGYLGIVAVAMLAGFGAADLLKRISAPQLKAAAAVAAISIAAFEPLCAPLWFARYTGISPIYATIRADPKAVVVELPFWPTAASFRQAPYMLNSTEHWKPMLNGYSGFQPPSFERNVAALENFPDRTSLAALRHEGVTHMFVHESLVGAERVADLERMPGVKRIASDGDIRLYRLYDVPSR